MAGRGVHGPVGGEVAAGAALLVTLEDDEAPHSGLADAADTELAVVVEGAVGTAAAKKTTLVGFYFLFSS